MNIILISIDTLSAQHLSCHGYHRSTSPFLDSLAAKGVHFTQMIAPSVPTTPAYTSIFTGTTGYTNRIVTHGQQNIMLDERFQFFPNVLRDQGGYATAMVSNLPHIKPWFADAADEVVEAKGDRLIQNITGDTISDRGLSWIDGHRDGPFFLFLHYWDPHTPYDPPDHMKRLYYEDDEKDPANTSLHEHRTQVTYPMFYKFWYEQYLQGVTDADYITALYDAEITFVDGKMRDLLHELDQRGLRDNTAVIITSDHGESMTDHQIYWDHPAAYEDQIHVPLIMTGPGDLLSAKRIDALVQHVDLAPTILELAGMNPLGTEIGEQLEGRSLLPLLRGEKQELWDYVYLTECMCSARMGIRSTEWKLLKTIDPGCYDRPGLELYRIAADPGERQDVYREHPDVASELEKQLDRWVDGRLGQNANPVAYEAQCGLRGVIRNQQALERMGMTFEEFQREVVFC